MDVLKQNEIVILSVGNMVPVGATPSSKGLQENDGKLGSNGNFWGTGNSLPQ
jgi:hypothetical protein